jgi:hypothetical protein
MLKRSFLQPLLVTQVSFMITFFFFIFSQYYKPIFAFRIFCLDVVGLLGSCILYHLIKPEYRSLIKRNLLIVFTYFTAHELVDHLIYFIKHHRFGASSLTDIVETATAILTFMVTLIISSLVTFHIKTFKKD